MKRSYSQGGMLTAAAILLVFFATALVGEGCKRKNSDSDSELAIPDETKRTTPGPKVRFTEITAKAGIRFTHINGAFGQKLLPETMGGGVAFLDFDKDGKQDLLFVNSCYWPGHEDKSKPSPTLVLYRNKGNGTFEDVSEKCGLNVTLYGMGVTVGDYDNDGWPDVFISAVGGNRLFHNVADGRGGRKFADVTAAAGDLGKGTPLAGLGSNFLARKDPIPFPSSAAFLDYDNDGLLDLFVCYYLTWSPHIDLDQGCALKDFGRAYCPPRAFSGAQCALFRNLGDGAFANVSAKAGILVKNERGEPEGKALGVSVWDVDGDGWPDIFVANDTQRNFFFHNKGDGTFEEIGRQAGIALAEGTPRGAMGIDFAEYRPGKTGIIIANFADEPLTLARLDDPKRLLFSDVAMLEGLSHLSSIVLKFGLFFFDFDLDGLLDLLICNGHLEPSISLVQPRQNYKQPVQLFWNTGGRRAFEIVNKEEVGPELFRPIVGRGCAYADIDGNGTLDVVLVENGGPARLFKNENATGNHWIRFVLEGDGKRTNTSAIGAVVTLTADGKTQTRHVTSARGYLSQSELPVTFGLGKTAKVERVEIRWPGRNAGVTVRENLAADRAHHVRQE
jgi:enediyne biosynthesis protein E4